MKKMINNKQVERHIRYGDAFVTQEKYADAIEEYRQALKIDKTCAIAHKRAGDVFVVLKKNDLAKKEYEQARIIDPDYYDAVNVLGSVYLREEDNSKAANLFQRAIDIDPKQKNAYNNLGIALEALKYYEGSISAYKKAIKIDPKYAGAYYNLGYVYKIMDRMDESVEAHFTAVDLDPNLAEPISILYLEMTLRCDWKRARKLSEKMDVLTDRTFNGVGKMMEQAYVSIFRSVDEQRSLKIAKYWARLFGRRAKREKLHFSFSKRKRKKKKLTIGYASFDFRNHPVGQQVVDLFAAHDREKFHIIGYSYGFNDGGEIQQRIKKGVDEWVDMTKMSRIEMAQKIYDDKVDILLDMTGYTNGCRMEFVAMRPAPIIINWLGYPGTSGADFIDYMIVDKTIVPDGAEGAFSEKLIYMPDCYSVTSKPVVSKEKTTRSDHDLPQNAIVLASFNLSTKIGPMIFEVWMNILNRTENTVLWLWKKHEKVEEVLRREAEKRGVDPERLIFGESIPSVNHLERIAHADLALDTQMISGGATTSQALWAGVPVVTTKGSHYLSRMSASMVSAAGLPELVTKDLKAYEDKVVELASDRSRLDKLKKKLKKNIKTAPLFDTKLFARNLEKEYRRIWEDWVEGKE